MKKVMVVKSSEVEIKPFILDHFIQDKEPYATMNKVSKKELKELAEELGLHADESHLTFAKKLFNAYIKRNK